MILAWLYFNYVRENTMEHIMFPDVQYTFQTYMGAR